jgi:hypothetical protein
MREAVHEHRTEQALERVAQGDAERGGNGALRGQVGDERADKDRRPHLQTEDEERGECDSGRRPDGGGARVHKCEPQTEFGRDEIQARQSRECYQISGRREFHSGRPNPTAVVSHSGFANAPRVRLAMLR